MGAERHDSTGTALINRLFQIEFPHGHRLHRPNRLAAGCHVGGIPVTVEVIPPLLTVFTPGGAVDADSVARMTRRLVNAGCTGLWVNGTTGEFFATSEAERVAMIEASVDAASQSSRSTRIIAQVGDTSIRRATHMAQQAHQAGASELAAVTPYYLAHDEEELVHYYRTISEATELTVMGYHLPAFTKVTLRPALVTRLHQLEVMNGVKESSEDISYLRSLVAEQRRSETPYPVYIGGGRLLDASLLSGATGSMSAIANLIPRTVVSLVEAFERDDWTTVRAAQRDIRTVSDALALPDRPSWGTMILAMKSILVMLDVIGTNACTPGLRSLTPDEVAQLESHALPLVVDAEARWERESASRAG